MTIEKTDARCFWNAVCLCCNVVEKEMVRIGVLVFCPGCFKTEFYERPETAQQVYSEWLAKYKEKEDV